jgi:hypothetical protein
MSEIKELIGKEIVSDEGVECYVVHADREIGITIHEMVDDTEVFCLNKKEFLALPIRNANRLYHEVFTIMIKMIEEGGIRNVRVFHTEIDGKCLVTPTTGISIGFACAYK